MAKIARLILTFAVIFPVKTAQGVKISMAILAVLVHLAFPVSAEMLKIGILASPGSGIIRKLDLGTCVFSHKVN